MFDNDPELKQFLELASLPPVQWQEAVDKLSEQERQRLDRIGSGTIVRLTRFYGYLDKRFGAGCGDQGHKAAVKNSNSKSAKVRKALGYSIPYDGINF